MSAGMDRDDDWYVLIFEAFSPQRGLVLSQKIRFGSDHGQALVHAATLALQHRPDHPSFPRRRQVFRTAPDSWTVSIEGFSGFSYFFTVCVANLIHDTE